MSREQPPELQQEAQGVVHMDGVPTSGRGGRHILKNIASYHIVLYGVVSYRTRMVLYSIVSDEDPLQRSGVAEMFQGGFEDDSVFCATYLSRLGGREDPRESADCRTSCFSARN